MLNNSSFGRNSDSRINYGIILTVILFAIIGILSVYSTTTLIEGKDIRATLFHALWYGIGAIAIIFTMQFDSEQYWKMANYLYILGIFSLIFILIFYDRETAALTGARSWFVVGSFSFQPSEVFKPMYIIFLSRLVVEHNAKYINRTSKSDWLLLSKAGLVYLLPFVLIQLQNDLGTNLAILSITAGIIFMSGIGWKVLGPIIGLGAAGAGLIFYLAGFQRDFLLKTGILQSYQIDRIDAWLNPFGDMQDNAYQLAQSLKAVGSGMLTGKGFGVSEVVVPVRESDFIFTTIAENTGFIGGSLVLLLYFVLIYQLVQNAFETRNEFYTYITAGVTSMILFHVVQNIGMTIGVLPITGVPLPFISQGGSALLSNMLGIGLILSMRYQTHNTSLNSSRINPYIK